MSYVRTSGSGGQVMAVQAPLAFSQAGAVQNTWYTALDTINVRIYAGYLLCTVANETLEIRLTLDGQAPVTTSQAAVAGTPYYFNFGTANDLALTSVWLSVVKAFLVEARHLKIEVRKTTNTGASAIQVYCASARMT